jgi:hypothetical protein
MKLNIIGLLLGFLFGAFIVLLPAKPAYAECRVNCWSRGCALDYGVTADKEPYIVTHAEWINDNIKTWDSEGLDCSGLVNKTWGMKDNSGSTLFYWWFPDEHLPAQKFFARNYYYGCNGACTTVCDSGSLTNCPYTATEPMDAFVTLNSPSSDADDHIGLIYLEDAGGYDWILEAVENPFGGDQDVHIERHSWRITPGYRGIRRIGWYSDTLCSGLTCPSGCPIHLPLINKFGPTLNKVLEYPNPYPTPGRQSSPYPTPSRQSTPYP